MGSNKPARNRAIREKISSCHPPAAHGLPLCFCLQCLPLPRPPPPPRPLRTIRALPSRRWFCPNRSTPSAPAPARPARSTGRTQLDYVMHASLDTVAKTLSNDEVITYTNNSPDTLTSLWIHLEQNIYRKDSRSANLGDAETPRRPARPVIGAPAKPAAVASPADEHTEGFVFELVETEAGGQGPVRGVAADYLIDDTRMQIRLATPLKPHSAMRIHMRYHYTIPGAWGGRTSWASAEHGDIYDIAQWYPRMCVYDDLRGWDTLPYLGSEFYLGVRPLRLFRHGSVKLPGRRLRRTHEPHRGSHFNPDCAPRTGAPLRQDRLHPHARRSHRTRIPAEADRHAHVALPHGEHPRCRLLRFADIRVGCRPDQPAQRSRRASRRRTPGGQSLARDVRLPGRERRPRHLDALYRIPQGRYRGLLATVVPLPLSQRDQRRRILHRHGVPRRRLRWHPRFRQLPLLGDRA